MNEKYDMENNGLITELFNVSGKIALVI